MLFDHPNRVDIHTFRYDEIESAHLAALSEYLSDPEKQQLSKMDPVRGNRFLTEKALTRKILASHLNLPPSSLEFQRSDKGKPELLTGDSNHPGIKFNLSHCNDLFVLAVTQGRNIGVDVERLQRSNNLERIALHYFSDSEISFLMSNPDQLEPRFVHLWTIKEAIGKLRGSGINKTFLKQATRIQDGEILPNLDWLNEAIVCRCFALDSHFMSLAIATEKEPEINMLEMDWKAV